MLMILGITFLFTPVNAEVVGGAERDLSQLDFAMIDTESLSIDIAFHGSHPAGELYPSPLPRDEFEKEDDRECCTVQVRQAIDRVPGGNPVDATHMCEFARANTRKLHSRQASLLEQGFLLGCEVFPYSKRRQYFRKCIEPLVQQNARNRLPHYRILGPLKEERKPWLLVRTPQRRNNDPKTSRAVQLNWRRPRRGAAAGGSIWLAA